MAMTRISLQTRELLSEYFLIITLMENQGKSRVSHKVETRYQYDLTSLLTATRPLIFQKANTSD